jgi:hypothetical protein
MPRGGKRVGSGRTPLAETNLCRWIVRRVREIGNEPEFIRERSVQVVKRTDKNQVDNLVELDAAYQKLKLASIPERRAMIADDFGTPLEETRQILETSGFPKYLQLPRPNQYMMRKIYERVAAEATDHFQKRTTVRKVKDCVGAWLKFERSFKSSP